MPKCWTVVVLTDELTGEETSLAYASTQFHGKKENPERRFVP